MGHLRFPYCSLEISGELTYNLELVDLSDLLCRYWKDVVHSFLAMMRTRLRFAFYFAAENLRGLHMELILRHADVSIRTQCHLLAHKHRVKVGKATLVLA